MSYEKITSMTVLKGKKKGLKITGYSNNVVPAYNETWEILEREDRDTEAILEDTYSTLVGGSYQFLNSADSVCRFGFTFATLYSNHMKKEQNLTSGSYTIKSNLDRIQRHKSFQSLLNEVVEKDKDFYTKKNGEIYNLGWVFMDFMSLLKANGGNYEKLLREVEVYKLSEDLFVDYCMGRNPKEFSSDYYISYHGRFIDMNLSGRYYSRKKTYNLKDVLKIMDKYSWYYNDDVEIYKGDDILSIEDMIEIADKNNIGFIDKFKGREPLNDLISKDEIEDIEECVSNNDLKGLIQKINNLNI